MVMNPPSASDKSSLLAPGEALINPAAPPTVTHDLSENVILTTVDDLYNWCRLSSLFPLLYGTACCFIEFAALIDRGSTLTALGCCLGPVPVRPTC